MVIDGEGMNCDLIVVNGNGWMDDKEQEAITTKQEEGLGFLSFPFGHALRQMIVSCFDLTGGKLAMLSSAHSVAALSLTAAQEFNDSI